MKWDLHFIILNIFLELIMLNIYMHRMVNNQEIWIIDCNINIKLNGMVQWKIGGCLCCTMKDTAYVFFFFLELCLFCFLLKIRNDRITALWWTDILFLDRQIALVSFCSSWRSFVQEYGSFFYLFSFQTAQEWS